MFLFHSPVFEEEASYITPLILKINGLSASQLFLRKVCCYNKTMLLVKPLYSIDLQNKAFFLTFFQSHSLTFAFSVYIIWCLDLELIPPYITPRT